MRPIVCATRGGQASRRTQERAIALAKERGVPLIFVCAVNPDFAGPLDDVLAAALRDELRRLGRALLLVAEARARAQGVEVRTDVRCGPVWSNIVEYLEQVNAGALVIGAPRTPTQAFGPATVDQQAESIRQTLGIDVIVVR